MARKVFSGSEIAIWDSAIPLSEEYVKECQKEPKNIPGRWWVCKDKMHVGYIVIQEYLEMLLNYVCTPVLDSNSLCR